MAGADRGRSVTSGAIELRGLRVLGRHGVGEAERSVAQPFEIDADVHFDVGPAASEDELVATIDYGRLTGVAAEVVSGTSRNLLESLAVDVAEALLAMDHRVEAVAVTVRKLRPPVPLHLGSAGVRVAISRADGGMQA